MKIFLTNEAENKGYSASVRALAETVEIPIILDAQYIENEKNLLKGMTLVSAGAMGFELFKRYGDGNPMILVTDRYGYECLNALDTTELTVIAPQDAIDKYVKDGAKATFIAADLVAAPTKEKMLDYAEDFQNKNILMDVSYEIEWCNPQFFFFFGGRVAAPTRENPQNWKENTASQFEKTAQKLMKDADGLDTMVVFHGLRSRTRGDGSENFGPQNAAINVINEVRKPRQKVVIFAVTQYGPTVIAIDDDGMRSYQVENPNAGAYYAAMQMAVETGAVMEFTAEQMNFTNEALTMGADWRNLIPVGKEDGWKLTVDANEKTHQKVFGMLRDGLKPLTQVEAFKAWCWNNETSNI